MRCLRGPSRFVSCCAYVFRALTFWAASGTEQSCAVASSLQRKDRHYLGAGDHEAAHSRGSISRYSCFAKATPPGSICIRQSCCPLVQVPPARPLATKNKWLELTIRTYRATTGCLAPALRERVGGWIGRWGSPVPRRLGRTAVGLGIFLQLVSN